MSRLQAFGLALLTTAWLSPTTALAAADADLVVLVVDAQRLETRLPLYARIDAQAAALASANPAAKSSATLAAELRKSEILTALPEIIARLAMAANADLVLDQAVAERMGEKGAQDLTAAVEAQIEARFADKPLEPAT